MKIVLAVLSIGCLSACTSEPHGDEECEEHQESFSIVQAPLAVPGGSFGLILLDVGQGDSTVVIAPGGCAALLDGGPTGAGDAVIKPALAALGVTSLDFAISSHLHADHIGGLDEVDSGAGAVPIATIYDRGGSYASATFDQYAAHFGSRRQTPSVGQSWSLCGEVAFDVIAVNANGTSTTNENGNSVTVKISYGAFDALVGGDLTGASPDIESSVAPVVGEIELYKVHHHGSATSSNSTLVSTLLPTVSLIPVGASNPYGHPHPDTMARLDSVGSAVWMTENPATGQALGHLQVVTANGSSYDVIQGSSSATYASKGSPPPAPDTTPPSVPASVTAMAASSTRIDVAWNASTDNVGVTSYTIRRDGAVLATTSGTSYADTTVGPGQTHSYTIAASDAAGNKSSASAPATATTPSGACTVAITRLQYSNNSHQLTIRATSSQQPSAVLSATADGGALGAMPFLATKGYYELKTTWPAQPACVGVTANCGGSATHCF
jgi:beta-lactamase superfamily II metal-dependent hydrolase